MAKINQIQRRLRELDGGSFQKLADSYLLKKGYQQINPLGSVLASNKVKKGTPDTLIPLPDGKYIFAEYTTQESNVFEKCKKDLDNCFDEDKTGVSVKKIQEVVLCHTIDLSLAELDSLRETCQKNGVNLNVFGIGTISYDLLEKYPKIARDYLGVEIDTGQIVDVDEFIDLYGKNKLVTGLDTTFHFREEEISQIVTALEENDLVIISGKAGVGKSRLALECCKIFKQEHSSYTILCIFNRGVDLFEDIQVHFLESGDFLVFVDDANRISGFTFFIQLLQNQRDDQRIKVIATVRDYALEKVREISRPYGTPFEKNLGPLSDKQIEQLVEDEYEIRNYLYLTRITKISQGNPRLAIMASQLAKEENSLDSIADISGIYEKYFASIRTDLQELADPNVFKIAGIVALFHSIDRSDIKLMSDIETAFAVTDDDFWRGCKILNEMELFDMYENEVIKVSDQVLATYLFYCVFFKDNIFDFGLILTHFYPRFRRQLIDAIHPVLNDFDTHTIIEKMRPPVDQTWKVIKKDGSESYALEFLEVFWFLKETETLVYIKEIISKMKPEAAEIANIRFETEFQTYPPQMLSLLAVFKYSKVEHFSMALELFCDYLTNRPKNVPEVLHYFVEDFSFEPDRYDPDFIVQKLVIETLCKQTNRDKNILFAKLFVAVAKKYLQTHFIKPKPVRKDMVTIQYFDLPETTPLMELRKMIWDQLFRFFQFDDLAGDVLNLLENYTEADHGTSVNKIIEQDAEVVLKFFDTKLDQSNFLHCLVVQKNLKFLSRFDIPFSQALQKRFYSDSYTLYKLFTNDYWEEEKEFGFNLEKCEENKRQKIVANTKNYCVEEYTCFFEQCLEIKKYLNNEKEYQLLRGVEIVLTALSERAPNIYAEVLSDYLKKGDKLRINPQVIVKSLFSSCAISKAYKALNEAVLPTRRKWLFLIIKRILSSCGLFKAYKVLYEMFFSTQRKWLFLIVKTILSSCGLSRVYKAFNEPVFPTQRKWLFFFYYHLPKNEIKKEHNEQLIALLLDAEIGDYPQDLDFLLKYQSLDGKIVARVTKIILGKAKGDSNHAFILSTLFNPYSTIIEEITEIFSKDIDLLERAYLSVDRIKDHFDLNGLVYSKILDIDLAFAGKYIDDMYNRKNLPSRHVDLRKYIFLWHRIDYEKVMKQIILRVFEHESKKHYFFYLEAFFGVDRDTQKDESVIDKQDSFLKKIIKERSSDIEFMRFLFTNIAKFNPSRRIPLIAYFVGNNKSFHDFKKLPLEPSYSSWWGSAIPMYAEKIDFLESLSKVFNTVEYLEHKQFIEQIIKNFRAKIQITKKKEFTENQS